MKLISSVIVDSAPEKKRALASLASESELHCEKPDESLVLFEIGELDSDDDDDDDDDEILLAAAEESKRAAVAACRIIDMNGSGPDKPVSEMQDPCYELNGDFEPTAYQPKYQAILATGEDDDEFAPPRQMLGFAAYHGPKFIPAEIKDNIEHWRSKTVTSAPRLTVAPPPNLFRNW